MQRSISLLINYIYVCHVTKQCCCALQSLSEHHNVQSRSPIEIQRIHVAILLYQSVHNFSAATPMQRCSAKLHVLGFQTVGLVVKEIADIAWSGRSTCKQTLNVTGTLYFSTNVQCKDE